MASSSAGLSSMSLMKIAGGGLPSGTTTRAASGGSTSSASTAPHETSDGGMADRVGDEGRSSGNDRQEGADPSGGLRKSHSADFQGEDGCEKTTPGKKKQLGTATSAPTPREVPSTGGLGAASGKVKKQPLWPKPKKEGVVLSLIVGCDVGSLYQNFIEDNERSQLWEKFMRRRKYDNVVMRPWAKDDDNRIANRQIEYVTGFDSPFIRGKHKTYEFQTVLVSSKGSAYVIESKARVPTIPIADSVITVLQWCFAAHGKDRTCVEVSYELIYKKKTSFKNIIEKSSRDGVECSMKDFRSALSSMYKVEDAEIQKLKKVEPPQKSMFSLYNIKVDSMLFHQFFGVLMSYPHAMLALCCALYLFFCRFAGAAVNGGSREGADYIHMQSTDGPLTCDVVGTCYDDGSNRWRTEEATAVLGLTSASSIRVFCIYGIEFWLFGIAFKFIILSCHWVITNMDIFVKFISFLVDSVKGLFGGSSEEDLKKLPSGAMVPAAAEAAAIVSKIARLSGLSPAAQAKAVKGIRDQKQAELVRQSTFMQGDEDSGVVVEEVFENQRYQPFRSWGSSWPGHLLPTDCGRWSNREGLPKVGAQSQMFELVAPALPPNWVWLETEWQIDLSGLKESRVDKDGFFYGVLAFSSLKDYPVEPGSGKKTKKHFVRRRRWIRTRIHSWKIRDVLTSKAPASGPMAFDKDISKDASLKSKIEMLLGWRKKDKLPSAIIERQREAALDDDDDASGIAPYVVQENTSRAPSDVRSERDADSRRTESKDVILEEVFEHEQRIGSHSEWTAPINAGNLKRWSTRRCSVCSNLFNEVAPALPPGWKWVGDWNIDNSTEYAHKLDHDGWTYGRSFFPNLIKTASGSGLPAFPGGERKQSIEHKARRRRWIRHRRRVGEDEDPKSTGDTVCPEVDSNEVHNSRGLVALDLESSPVQSPVHRRTGSKQLLEVLDLSGTVDTRDGPDVSDSSESSVTFTSISNATADALLGEEDHVESQAMKSPGSVKSPSGEPLEDIQEQDQPPSNSSSEAMSCEGSGEERCKDTDPQSSTHTS